MASIRSFKIWNESCAILQISPRRPPDDLKWVTDVSMQWTQITYTNQINKSKQQTHIQTEQFTHLSIQTSAVFRQHRASKQFSTYNMKPKHKNKPYKQHHKHIVNLTSTRFQEWLQSLNWFHVDCASLIVFMRFWQTLEVDSCFVCKVSYCCCAWCLVICMTTLLSALDWEDDCRHPM